jgi:hypothetical protein
MHLKRQPDQTSPQLQFNLTGPQLQFSLPSLQPHLNRNLFHLCLRAMWLQHQQRPRQKQRQ